MEISCNGALARPALRLSEQVLFLPQLVIVFPIVELNKTCLRRCILAIEINHSNCITFYTADASLLSYPPATDSESHTAAKSQGGMRRCHPQPILRETRQRGKRCRAPVGNRHVPHMRSVRRTLDEAPISWRTPDWRRPSAGCVPRTARVCRFVFARSVGG
jgi:hypothetical protein